MLASKEASSRQQEGAGNKQYATAVSVTPVAALTADTMATKDLTAHWAILVSDDLGSVSTSSSQMGGGSGNGSTPVTPSRDSARAARMHSRAEFAARQRTERERLAQLEAR